MKVNFLRNDDIESFSDYKKFLNERWANDVVVDNNWDINPLMVVDTSYPGVSLIVSKGVANEYNIKGDGEYYLVYFNNWGALGAEWVTGWDFESDYIFVPAKQFESMFFKYDEDRLCTVLEKYFSSNILEAVNTNELTKTNENEEMSI